MLSKRLVKRLMIAIAFVLASCQPFRTAQIIPTGTPVVANTTPISTNTNVPSPTSMPLPTPNPALGPLQIVGQIGGPTQAVAVAGNYAYVSVGSRLTVLDVSTPSSPRELGSSEPFGAAVRDVEVFGNSAFVAAGGAGLYILDISNPAQPNILGNYKSSGYTEGVTVAGKYAYVADGPDGLRIVDITDRTHPVEVSAVYSLNYAFDVVVDGSYAYIAAAGAGLLVADISDPTHPKEISSIGLSGYAFGVSSTGNTVYVADGWEGLRVVDVSNPSQPKEIGSFVAPGWAYDVAIAGNNAYVADSFDGVLIMDVSVPEKPVMLASYDMPDNQVNRLAIGGVMVYVASRNAGLGILDVSSPAKPIRVGLYSSMGYADDVAISGHYAYVAAGPYGMRVIDIADPSHPQEIGSYDTHQAYATGIVVAGSYAYVINNGFSKEMPAGLHVVDVSDPAHPTQVSFYESRGQPQDVVINGETVYIANEFGLELIDVSKPDSPVLLSAMDFSKGNPSKSPHATWGVAVSGNTVYVTHADYGVEVVDVSDPRNPSIVGNYKSADVQKALAITIGGSFAYVTDVPMHILDIANPTKPVEVGSYDLAAGDRIAIAGHKLYGAGGGAGLEIIDISNPHQPTRLALKPLPGIGLGLAVKENYVFVADGWGGLFVVADTSGSAQGWQVPTAPMQTISFFERGSFASPLALATDTHDVGQNRYASTTISQENRRPTDHEGLVLPNSTVVDCSARPPSTSNLTLTVTSTADSGPGTLREALGFANKTSDGATIVFDPQVFPPQHPATIFITTGGLGAGHNIIIDASNAGVILDGSKAVSGTSGLGLSDYNTVKGLQIINFPDQGITVNGSYNTIGGNRARGNGPMGEGNLISGNGFAGVMLNGTRIKGEVTMCNRVIGNYIGVDLSGQKTLANKEAGVFVYDGAYGNLIGDASEADRNVISGNGVGEVELHTHAYENTVINNYIGTDAAGKNALGNSIAGVLIEAGAYSNAVQHNVIGNNGGSCVVITDSGSWGNAVIGNFIGVDATGTKSLGGKGNGVAVNEPYNRIGGTAPGEGNVISGNGGGGVMIGWQGMDVMILGNYIGTDISGTKSLGNSNGISIEGPSAQHAFIGGVTNAERNLVGGNNGNAISVEGVGNDYNFIVGNFIGTNAKGKLFLPNGGRGVEVIGGDQNFILQNAIAYSKTGVNLTGDDNHVYYNDFSGNGVNAQDEGQGNLWDDGSIGNYWYDYKGKDANGDGLGDTPYNILPNGTDHYPLMKPFP